jgi:hypothetical protein
MMMPDMRFICNRRRLVALLTLTWQVMAIAAVSTALACDPSVASEHAGISDCPLHDNAPACPLHAEKHGTHQCDCPTIDCAETDTGLMTLLGAVGILGAASDMLVSIDAGDARNMITESADTLAPAPLSPPPRT